MRDEPEARDCAGLSCHTACLRSGLEDPGFCGSPHNYLPDGGMISANREEIVRGRERGPEAGRERQNKRLDSMRSLSAKPTPQEPNTVHPLPANAQVARPLTANFDFSQLKNT